MPNPLAPILYLPHGGGPLPLLNDSRHQAMIEFLTGIALRLPRPSAIVVISAHWEADVATVTAATAPQLIYDYSGFPPEAYQIQYPTPGAPALAHRINTLLNTHGLRCQLDGQRGFDHGLYVPLKLMYPSADIPCLQLSLLAGLNAHAHIQLGKALIDLRGENILIIGSGFSFHNLSALLSGRTSTPDDKNLAFENWLYETCCDAALSSNDRENRLTAWTSAPFARYCHPREEHLLPLHVCFGIAAGTQAERVFAGEVLQKKASAFLWQ